MKEKKYRIFYKYMPFSDGSLKVLTEGTMKYTSPLEFNDPFDCRPTFNRESLKKLSDTKSDVFHSVGKAQGWPPAKRIMNKGKLAKEMERGFLSGDFMDKLLSRVGVVSLTTDPRNILMWSHYANFHRGFVVGFKVPTCGSFEDAKNWERNLYPLEVEYSESRPELRYGLETDRELLDKMALTKSKHWAYEKEFRVVDNKRGPGIHYYNRDRILFSVIAGMNMPRGEFNELRSLVSELRGVPAHNNLKFFQARPCERSYKLKILCAQ